MNTQTASSAGIEHVNITVTNPESTARMLCELFDWTIRWQGPSRMGGRTVHVGTEDQYLAVYTPEQRLDRIRTGALNHVGITVVDLEATEARIRAAGYETFNHGDYEPGRRFYFLDGDGIEYEIVTYDE